MGRIEIGPQFLVLTNDFLDMDVVDMMVKGLQNGTIKPEDLTRPYITFKDGTWYVNDGNHAVKAFQLAQVEKIEADTY
jgi:hypothetical protein